MSGKQSRRRRQAGKPARAPRSKASPAVLLASLAFVALVAVAAGLIATRGGGSSARPLAGAAGARALFRGIPQRENVLGSSSAPVTVVEYADLQCPYCRDFELQWTPSLVARYVRSGKAKLVFRPLAFIGADSVRGRNAVIAAGLQGRLFEAVQMLYASQGGENAGWLDDGLVQRVVAEIPQVEAARFFDATTSAAVARRAKGFDDAAIADGVRSTPTLLVGRSGERLHRVQPADLGAEIEAASR